MASTSSDVPDLLVKITGEKLPDAAYADLVDVSVIDDIEHLSAFTLRLVAWDDAANAVAWVDDKRFSLGNEVEVWLGYSGALSMVLKGEITGVDLELSSGDAPRFTVRGYDRRHRLLRSSQTRSFVNMKDSDIAAQIAQENQLTPDTVDTSAQLAYVLQNGQTDLEFLTMRAAAIGYEVVVDDKTLHFRPPDTGAKAALKLRPDRDLTDVAFHVTTRSQVGAVEVRAWDPMNKQAIVGKASSSDDTAMGSETSGATTGPDAADRAFGKATLKLVDLPIDKQEEADAVARGVLRQLALGFVLAEGGCLGRTDLGSGSVISITGVGDRFSGSYYVTTVTHRYSPKTGYKTSFSARRNAT